PLHPSNDPLAVADAAAKATRPPAALAPARAFFLRQLLQMLATACRVEEDGDGARRLVEFGQDWQAIGEGGLRLGIRWDMRGQRCVRGDGSAPPEREPPRYRRALWSFGDAPIREELALERLAKERVLVTIRTTVPAGATAEEKTLRIFDVVRATK